MDIWPQRIIFREHLADYLTKAGQTQEQFAEDLGISLSHLHSSLYRKHKRLGLDAIQRASALFSRLTPGERSVMNYIDDPGGLIAGQNLSYHSDEARFFATLIVKDVAAEDLTDDDRRYLYEDHLRALERLRQLHARGVGSPGTDRASGKPDNNGDLTGAGSGGSTGKK